MKMIKSAWVITQEGPSHPEEVIGILSSRNSDKRIKEYLEWLYALLHYSPREHFGCARYNNPHIPYRTQENWSWRGGVLSMMVCGHNPLSSRSPWQKFISDQFRCFTMDRTRSDCASASWCACSKQKTWRDDTSSDTSSLVSVASPHHGLERHIPGRSGFCRTEARAEIFWITGTTPSSSGTEGDPGAVTAGTRTKALAPWTALRAAE